MRVSVYDNPDLSQEVTIGADGAFSYPLIGRVQAAGLPVRQLEGLLAQRFADGYLVSPQVGVTVTQHKSQLVYVIGAVKTPGSYPLQRQTTLLEVLSAAGGPTPEAGSEVVLTHAADKQALPASTTSVSAAANGQPAMRVSLEQLMAGGVPQRISLQDGDVVYVPLAAFVYVTGEIQRPGRYRLESDTTIQKAVTLAGGFTKFAATKSMTVQRMINGKRQDFQAGLHEPAPGRRRYRCAPESLLTSSPSVRCQHASMRVGIACQVNLPETRLHRRIITCIKIFTG